MASHVSVSEVQAWLETTKLTLTVLDTEMEAHIASITLGQLMIAYPVQAPTWIDSTTTPKIVRSIIAMRYAGWFYDRQYSETPDSNTYADRLRASADALVAGLVAGSVDIIEVPGLPVMSEPEFFPTDVSSANLASDMYPSDGPPAFTMGQIF